MHQKVIKSLVFYLLGICFVKIKKVFTRTNVCDILSVSKIEGDGMNILKGYVFRMYPTKKQEQLINKTIGCCRFIYNYFLDDKIKEYKVTGKSKSAYDQIKLIPSLSKEYPFLKEVDSCALRNSLFNLEDAYKRFYKGSGYPKFKAKGVHESYKTNNIKSSYKGNNYNSIKLDLKNKTITLPKLKEVKIRGYRNKEVVPGNIKSAVIKKDAGKYYVSVLIEEELIKPAFVPKSIIGIDLGIKDLIVTSYNEKIENTIKLNTKRMIGLQRGLSRCKSGSKNRYKMKLKIQRLYQKIRNARKHMIHDIANKLIKENDIIVTENLDVKGMQKNHYIAKGLNKNPISEIMRVLKYKAVLNNKKLIQIDRYYPSSQICSVCNYQNRKAKDLKLRKWECPVCHIEHERDYNAAVNIMFKGLEKYMKEMKQGI